MLASVDAWLLHESISHGSMLLQLWGTSDPYCIVSIGDSIAKTTHKERTLNPIWDEDLRLYVRHVHCLLLQRQECLSICFAKASFNQVWCSVHLLMQEAQRLVRMS